MKVTTTFETSKINDRVWCVSLGWGVITDIYPLRDYPIVVKFDSGNKTTFKYGGQLYTGDCNQTLFWDEIEIIAPAKPLPKLEVDAKVTVWNRGVGKTRRHFSHFTPSGKIACFSDGLTSWTTKHTREWNEWELE